jgi:hypothetical protein
MMRNIYVLVMALFFISTGAYGAGVSKVKGSNALIDLQGEGAQPGDSYFTIGTDGKRHGIIQITKVKGDKAIAKIAKGKVDVGMTLEKRAGSGGMAAAGKSHKRGGSAGGEIPGGRPYWGALLGLGMDSMTAQVNSATISGKAIGKPALSGIGYGATGFFDYEMFPHIWFRGLGGIEGFNVAGSSICGSANNSACNASIYYITMDFMGRYVFTDGPFRPWLGGGVALMFPASKSATVLDSSSISNTSVIQIAGGLDWFINKDMFIPVSIEYGMLPKSNEVEASWIELRVGLGVPF